jgi:hypothetical protein
VERGRRASILVRTGYGTAQSAGPGQPGKAVVVDNLPAAADWILNQSSPMCGGYVGKRAAAPILLEGLRQLEYRGYDSAGLAVIRGRGGF